MVNKAVLVILSILVIALGVKVVMQENELDTLKSELNNMYSSISDDFIQEDDYYNDQDTLRSELNNMYSSISDEFLQEDDYYNNLEILYDRLKVLYDLHGLTMK